MMKPFTKCLSLLMTAVLLAGMIPAMPSAIATEEVAVVAQEIMQEAPAPEPVKEEAPAPEPIKEEAPAPEPVKEEAPAPEPIKEETAVEVSDTVEVAPADAPDATDVTPTDAPDDADVTPADAPDDADVAPIDTPNDADVTPTDMPDDVDVTPTDAPEDADVASTDAPEDADVAPTDAPDDADVTPTDAPGSVEEAPAAHEYLQFAPYQQGLAVVGCDEACEELVIPAVFGGKPVLLIAEEAFLKHEKLEMVEIEEGVEEIAKRAFQDCSALKRVKLPASLKELAPDAFDGCPLTSIDAPSDTLARAFADAWFAESAPIDAKNEEDPPSDDANQVDLLVLPEIDSPSIALSIISTADVLGIGRSLTLSAVISASSAIKSTVQWTLDDPKGDGLVTLRPKSRNLAATLTASGKMTEAREVNVTATLEGVSASYHVTIRPLTKTLKLDALVPNKTYLNLDNPEDKIQLAAIITPETASQTVQWVTSNAAVAKVSKDGVVTPGHKAGIVTITAKALDGSGRSARTSIRVQRFVTGIAFDSEEVHVAAKRTFRLVPTFTPNDLIAPALVWTTSNASVAKVNNGTISGVAPSDKPVTITAYLKDDMGLPVAERVQRSVKVWVHPLTTEVQVFNQNGTLVTKTAQPVVEIDDSATKEQPQTYQLSAKTLPSGTIPSIAWSSGNPRVATVDENGVVTLIAPPAKGKTAVRITAKALDGSNRSAFVTLTFQRSVKQLAIDGPNEIVANRSFSYKAVVTPDNASNPAVIWSLKEPVAGFSINASNGALKTPRTIPDGVSKVTIVATAKDGSGVVAEKTVTVKLAAGAFKIIGDTSIDISHQDSLKLKAMRVDENGNVTETPEEVVWTTSNRNVPVSADGVVTPIKASSRVIITATSLDGKQRQTHTLSVTSSVLSVENIGGDAVITLPRGKSVNLPVAVVPATATNQRLQWSCEPQGAAVINAAGRLTARVAGSITVTATSMENNRLRATFSVNVTEPAARVVVGGLPKTINLSELSDDTVLQLTASVQPANAPQQVVWTSSNPKVATIDENGVVTALKAGFVSIIATTTDGCNRRGNINLRFEYGPTSVSILDKETTHFAAGQRVTFTTQVLPANANQNVLWKSSNTAYATINNAGIAIFKNNTSSVQKVTLTATHKFYPAYHDEITVEISPKPAAGSLVLEKPEKYVLAYNGDDAYVNTLQMNAYTLPGEQKLAYTWYSSKPSVATVDENGLVTGVSAGTAYITVKDAYGNTARQEVQVYSAARSIKILEGNAMPMKAGEEITLHAKVGPDEAVQYVTWSTDSDLITLDDDNEAHTVKVTVKPDAKGEAIVKVVSDADERLAATCVITISNIKTTSISLDSNQNTFDAATTPQAQLKATVQPADASQQLNWSSSQPAVATVDQNGLLSFIGAGTTTITAAAKDGSNVSASINITVKVSIASVTITGDTTVKAGQSITLSAKVLPEIAKDTAAWSIVSGADAAEITQDGKLTAKTVDKATEVKVKAVSKKDSSKSATHIVTVLPVPRDIIITPTNPVVYLGSDGTTTLKASVVPSGASQKVSWSSSDTKIATVSQDGVVTIQKAKLVKGTKVSITATCVEDPSLQKTVEVTVQEAPLFEAEPVTGGVKLTKYLGSSSNIVVPAEFDGQKVMALADGLFKGNTTLTTLTLPSEITVLAKELCDGCSSLTTVNMSNGVTLIGEGAFRNCTKLTTFNCK